MATIAPEIAEWTAADLARRFGPIPLSRIRQDPVPGTATEEDLIAIHDHEDVLYELVDGVLVRKTMGWYEGYLASEIARRLGNFIVPRRLGVVVGSDGMYRLNPGLVRLPDVSFVAMAKLPKNRMPRYKICPVIPDLAVEVLSESNTKKEMAEKLADYFASGVRLVWYIDPKKKTARVFTGTDRSRLVRESQTLDGGDVLPGFTLSLRELFTDPTE